MSLNAHLNDLEASGLVRLAQAHPELEYLFRHALVQDAAYGSLVMADRLALHHAAGETLERLFPDRLAELAPQLGRHFDEAGDDELALRYLTTAGDAAAAAYANREAVQNYRRALEIARHVFETQGASAHDHAQSARHADTPRHAVSTPHASDPKHRATLQYLFLQCGRVLELLNHYPEAVTLYQEMEALAQPVADRPLELAAIMAQATAYLSVSATFNPAQAHALAARALRLAQDLSDRPAEATISWQQMRIHLYSHRQAEAVTVGERALALARELNLNEVAANLLNDLSRAYLTLGRTKAAIRALLEAEAIWREAGNVPGLTDTVGMLAQLHRLSGQLEEARRLGEEFDRLSRNSNSPWGKAAGGQTGLTLVELGEIDAGLARLNEGLELSESGRFGFGMAVLAAFLAVSHEWLGAFDRALAFAERAVMNAEAAFPVARSWTLPVLARMLAANGRLAEAEAVLQPDDPGGYQSPLTQYAYEAECLLALARDDAERAAALAERQIAANRADGNSVTLMDALALKGKALAALERLEEAQAAYAEARTLAEGMGNQRALWRILAALARLTAALGDHAQAYELRRQARAGLGFLADHIASAELRAALFSLPEAQEVLKK